MLGRVLLKKSFSTVPSTSSTEKAGPGLLTRMRSFSSGFLLASAAGFYITFVQMQALTDEIKGAIKSVTARQEAIERLLKKKQEEASSSQSQDQ